MSRSTVRPTGSGTLAAVATTEGEMLAAVAANRREHAAATATTMPATESDLPAAIAAAVDALRAAGHGVLADAAVTQYHESVKPAAVVPAIDVAPLAGPEVLAHDGEWNIVVASGNGTPARVFSAEHTLTKLDGLISDLAAVTASRRFTFRVVGGKVSSASVETAKPGAGKRTGETPYIITETRLARAERAAEKAAARLAALRATTPTA